MLIKKHMHRSIHNALHGFEPSSPFIMSADDDDGGDDKGGGSGRTFSQDDVNAIIAKERSKYEKKIAGLTEKLEGMSSKFEEQAEQLEQLQANSKGGNDLEAKLQKLQSKLEKQTERMKAIEVERDEAKGLATQSQQAIRSRDIREKVGSALLKAGVLKSASSQAVQVFIQETGADLDDDGSLSMTLDGVPITNVGKAAAKWLDKNNHFAEGSRGGSGGARPGATKGGFVPKEQIDGQSATANIAAGLGQKRT